MSNKLASASSEKSVTAFRAVVERVDSATPSSSGKEILTEYARIISQLSANGKSECDNVLLAAFVRGPIMCDGFFTEYAMILPNLVCKDYEEILRTLTAWMIALSSAHPSASSFFVSEHLVNFFAAVLLFLPRSSIAGEVSNLICCRSFNQKFKDLISSTMISSTILPPLSSLSLCLHRPIRNL